MAKIVKIGNLGTVLEQRILARIESLGPQDPRMREVLTRIGILVQTEAKRNIVRKHIIDTGSLLNSIRYRVLAMSGGSGKVEVGSYGVPYAAAHEFGFTGPALVKSHTRTSAFGRPTKPYTVPTHLRYARKYSQLVRKRPYLKPALQTVQGQIIELIRAYYRGSP